MTDENEFPVPLSWREHFGEEKFYDIFVYTKYGDRTPLEALGILGLEPPPEKKIEPRQESAEKLITVVDKPQTEPKQQSDVKKPVGQEVKMEAKVEKDNFFPKTTAQEAERKGGDFFPSMKGIPETIEIPTEASEKGGKSGRASMKIDEFPGFLQDRLETAHRWGDLSKTLRYYLSVADGGQIFDRGSISHLKRLAKNIDEAQSLEERKSILEQISQYLRSVKSVKI